MRHSLFALFLSVISALLVCSSTASAADQPLTKADVEAIVKQVITDNPELILSSVESYQRKKMAEDTSKASQTILSKKAEMEDDPNSPFVGDPKGDVTLVEFFDYHCGYCKQFLPTVAELASEDKHLKIVFKEFPILAPDSDLAARASLAVYSIDRTKYLAYHTLLMRMSTTFTEDNLMEKAKTVGIGEAAFRKAYNNPDLSKELDKTRELAYSLNIHGTPAIVLGNELIPGVVSINELREKIAALRETK